MIEDGVHRDLVALNDVQDAGRSTGLHHQLGQPDRNRRVLFRRLENEGVAGGDGDAEHPHRDHRREVERRNACRNAQRLAHRIDVDAGPGAFGIFALQRVRDAAGELDDLQAALDIALGVGDHLAMLAGKQLGQVLHIGLDQALEVEHHPGAALGIDQGPGLLGANRGLNREINLGDGGQRDASLHLPGVGIEDVAQKARGTGDRAAVDEVGDVAHGRAFRPGEFFAQTVSHGMMH